MKALKKARRVLNRAWQWLIGRRVFIVEVYGKKVELRSCGRSLPISPQNYVEYHAVACGCCGEVMLPGNKVWVCKPADPEAYKKDGVLEVDLGDGEKGLVACLSPSCCPTLLCMCGEIEQGRKVSFFESPMQKVLRTNEPVIVPDIRAYQG